MNNSVGLLNSVIEGLCARSSAGGGTSSFSLSHVPISSTVGSLRDRRRLETKEYKSPAALSETLCGYGHSSMAWCLGLWARSRQSAGGNTSNLTEPIIKGQCPT